MIIKLVCSECEAVLDIESGETVNGILELSVKPCDCKEGTIADI